MPTDNTGTVITTLTAVGDSVVMRCHQRQRRPHHQIVGRLTPVGTPPRLPSTPHQLRREHRLVDTELTKNFPKPLDFCSRGMSRPGGLDLDSRSRCHNILVLYWVHRYRPSLACWATLRAA